MNNVEEFTASICLSEKFSLLIICHLAQVRLLQVLDYSN